MTAQADKRAAPRMVAMQLDAPGQPLRAVHRPIPVPGPGQILIEVSACGICRTDLHVIDGDIRGPMPIVPGHEVIGRVAQVGGGAFGFVRGQRVGVPWLGHTCGSCFYCNAGMENLCDLPQFTGFTRDGAQQHEQDRQHQVMTAFVEEAECREEQPWQRASVGSRAVVSRDETRRRAAFPREGW